MNHADIPAKLRELANLADFSRRSGIPRRTLVRIASGDANPMFATCEKIADALRTLRPARRRPEQDAA